MEVAATAARGRLPVFPDKTPCITKRAPANAISPIGSASDAQTPLLLPVLPALWVLLLLVAKVTAKVIASAVPYCPTHADCLGGSRVWELVQRTPSRDRAR